MFLQNWEPSGANHFQQMVYNNLGKAFDSLVFGADNYHAR